MGPCLAWTSYGLEGVGLEGEEEREVIGRQEGLRGLFVGVLMVYVNLNKIIILHVLSRGGIAL